MSDEYDGMVEPGSAYEALNPDDGDGAALLEDVRGFLGRFVAFPSEAALTAVTLWAAHTWLIEEFESTGRLALLSPEPGSGKTRCLEVLNLLCAAPMPMVNANPAPIFRRLADGPRTLLVDEVDAIFGGRSSSSDDPRADLRALLNEGHRRGATVDRCVGPKQEVAEFPVFAACALAGLGDLPDTLMDRSVIVRMRRRAPGERVEPFRRRLHGAAGAGLADRLAGWADTIRPAIVDTWPAMPPGIEDRPADVWEPLLAVADAAGGHWPDTARDACVELVKAGATREASLGIKLLADLREIFGDADALWTKTILERLCQLDESPWADLRGKELDERGLARRLRQYEVRSVDVKLGEVNRKGYRREHLWDAWARYLPDTYVPVSATCATSATEEGVSAGQSLFGQVADAVAHGGQVADTSATGNLSATRETPPDLRRSGGSGGSAPGGQVPDPGPPGGLFQTSSPSVPSGPSTRVSGEPREPVPDVPHSAAPETGKPVCPGCGAPISPLAAALDGACARCQAIAS